MLKTALSVAVFVSLLASAIAAEERMPRELANGLAAFERGAYEAALGHFEAARLQADSSGWHGHATFWSGRARAALERFNSAVAMYDRVISEYPAHPLVEEARFHRAHAASLQGDHEAAIRRFTAFQEHHPTSELRSEAAYRTAESLVSLGRIDEAEPLVAAVMEQHPWGDRAEATRYGIDLIAYARREADLLRLLQWNRDEYLAALSQLELTVEDRDRRIAELIGELQQLRGTSSHGLAASAAPDLRDELLRLRARALELQETILAQDRKHE
jgi:outer membrane protein assembly factor BamD (BamD/ComL family)